MLRYYNNEKPMTEFLAHFYNCRVAFVAGVTATDWQGI